MNKGIKIILIVTIVTAIIGLGLTIDSHRNEIKDTYTNNNLNVLPQDQFNSVLQDQITHVKKSVSSVTSLRTVNTKTDKLVLQDKIQVAIKSIDSAIETINSINPAETQKDAATNTLVNLNGLKYNLNALYTASQQDNFVNYGDENIDKIYVNINNYYDSVDDYIGFYDEIKK